MGDTIVDLTVDRTVKWAKAMQEWLSKYNDHIERLCKDQEIPKPPPW